MFSVHHLKSFQWATVVGVLNMTDDIVFGHDGKEHKERLLKVMDQLLACGLTLE